MGAPSNSWAFLMVISKWVISGHQWINGILKDYNEGTYVGMPRVS